MSRRGSSVAAGAPRPGPDRLGSGRRGSAAPVRRNPGRKGWPDFVQLRLVAVQGLSTDMAGRRGAEDWAQLNFKRPSRDHGVDRPHTAMPRAAIPAYSTMAVRLKPRPLPDDDGFITRFRRRDRASAAGRPFQRALAPYHADAGQRPFMRTIWVAADGSAMSRSSIKPATHAVEIVRLSSLADAAHHPRMQVRGAPLIGAAGHGWPWRCAKTIPMRRWIRRSKPCWRPARRRSTWPGR